MGRPRECENVLSCWSDCVFRQTLNRFPCCYQRLPPELESPLLLAPVRNGADPQPQSRRGGGLWVDDAFDFVAVSLARAGDDGKTVARCGTSCVARLPVFCSACESRLLCRLVFPALGRRVAARRGRSLARGSSFRSMDTAFGAGKRPPCHRANHSSRLVIYSLRHASHQDLWLGAFCCASI